MTEITTINKDTSVSLEVPRHTTLVTLPLIRVDGANIVTGIRLAMHTDSVLTFLHTLHAFPDLDQLKIEGRVLNEAQKKNLEQSQIYKFYLSGRIDRSGLSLPMSISMTPEIIAQLLKSRFSPSSLKKDIGYKTGYFNAEDLVEQWLNEGRPNDLLPIIGGVNELSIGSDTLSPQRLSAMATRLHQAFVEQEQSVQPSRTTITNKPSFIQYSIPTLFPKIIDHKNQIDNEVPQNDNEIPKNPLMNSFRELKRNNIN